MDYLSLEFWDKGRLLPHGLISSLISACWAVESDRRELEPSDEPLWVLGVQYDTRTGWWDEEIDCWECSTAPGQLGRRGDRLLAGGSAVQHQGRLVRLGDTLLGAGSTVRHWERLVGEEITPGSWECSTTPGQVMVRRGDFTRGSYVHSNARLLK